MATKAERGTKRTCQSGSCRQRFYDLGKDPITCPICGSLYTIARAATDTDRDAVARRVPRKPEPVPTMAEDPAPEVEAEDALADVAADDEAVAAGGDETFLEEEEDAGGDVSGIVGGGGAEPEEEG